MKNIFKYCFVALMSVLTLSVSSCKDDDGPAPAKAVLVSASGLNFEGTNPDTKIVTVYSDGAWTVDAPEWITVTPAEGVGTMDVEISVSDNLRDGALDNPRRYDLIFHGPSLASQAKVVIRQDGDKFRDGKEYQINEIDAVNDETVVAITNLTVMAVTSNGFVATDGTDNIWVLGSDISVAPGNMVKVQGEKWTDGMAYVLGERVTKLSDGQAVTYPQGTDITGSLDNMTLTKRDYITVTGVLDGNVLSVKGATNKVQFIEVAENLKLDDLKGHSVTIGGYFSGVAAPAVKVIASNLIADNGIAETIYFSDDFEWLAPHVQASGAGSTIETDDPGASSPQISAAGTKVDGVTAEGAAQARGYEFLRTCAPDKKAGECIYLNGNYFKFGKTSYQGGIILPAIEALGDGGIEGLKLSFVWSSQRQGSGVVDPTELVVILKNGDEETPVATLQHGIPDNGKLVWVNADVDLSGAKVDKNTRIIIRNTDAQWPNSKALRWFLDNIKISSPM